MLVVGSNPVDRLLNRIDPVNKESALRFNRNDYATLASVQQERFRGCDGKPQFHVDRSKRLRIASRLVRRLEKIGF